MAVFSAHTAAAGFSNGDFTAGLDGWTTQGDVTVEAGAGALSDNGVASSTLYQPIAWPAASFTLTFDFQNALSPDFSQGTFPDAGFASLYYIDDPQAFDPNANGYDAVVSLFDVSASGTFVMTGTVSPSDLGPEWSHYSVTLPNASGYIIPYFELHNLNFEDGDSTLYLDNFSVVPEPATWALFLTGAATLLIRGRRRWIHARC